MKKCIFLLMMFLYIAGFCFAADPVEGYWLSIDEKTGKVTAGWEIYTQGGKVFGKILSMADHPKTALADKCKESYQGFPVAGDVRKMTVVGTSWIFGLSMDKTGEWSNGSVINPEDGKMYKCKIIYRKADGKKFKTDMLEMRGEIGLGIGRSQFWQNSDLQAAGSLGPK